MCCQERLNHKHSALIQILHQTHIVDDNLYIPSKWENSVMVDIAHNTQEKKLKYCTSPIIPNKKLTSPSSNSKVHIYIYDQLIWIALNCDIFTYINTNGHHPIISTDRFPVPVRRYNGRLHHGLVVGALHPLRHRAVGQRFKAGQVGLQILGIGTKPIGSTILKPYWVVWIP